MSVPQSFQKLLVRIAPTSGEEARTRSHAETIRARLATSFALKKFMVAGSVSRGTFIHNSSDIDLFGVISRDEARRGDSYVSSKTMLEKFRLELEDRYPACTVYKDVHAIVVAFSDGCRVDVVPAIFFGWSKQNTPIYWMPDGNDWWMETSPPAHNAYIKKADERSFWKLKRTAKLLKYWRTCREPQVPISSFHIEMLLAANRTCDGIKGYAQCVTEAFQMLADRQCRDFQDPLKIAGYIGATRSASEQDRALRSVVHSREHAKAGLDAEAYRDTAEAKRQWDIVFNGQFPW